MPHTTDEILARLDHAGADVSLKRETYSPAARRWFCHLSIYRDGTTVSTGKHGETAAEAIDLAYAAFDATCAHGVPLKALIASARLDLALAQEVA